jgi:hypothetical protein
MRHGIGRLARGVLLVRVIALPAAAGGATFPDPHTSKPS